MAQKILREEGFEVETVSNGVAAIKKLPALQPVLVLADVSMPGKDGYEVCEFVKTSADLLHVPVLLVGSDLEPYDEQRGQQVRADGIIKKPFTARDLIDMVAKLTGPGEAPASRSALADKLIDETPAPPELLPETSLEPTPEPATPNLPQSSPEPQLVVPPEDVVGAPSEEIEESSSRGVEESTPREVDGLTLTPQLLDSSTSRLIDSSAPGAAVGAPSVIAPEWVYVVVHKVVAKMVPSVLPPEQVEEIVRKLTQEITSELGLAPPQLH
jgi:CheY-like chemotaxis protein